VRMAAAEIVANLPFAVANPNTDPLVRLAHDLWPESLRANAERSESQLGLAAWHINRREFAEAEACFKKAVLLEKRHTASYVNYADFLRRSQREAEAQSVLRQGIANGTEPAAAHHSLGLMLVTAGKTDEALEHLAIAANADLSPARYSFVYAVALHDTDQLDASLTVLETSLKTHRWDFESLQTLALYALESPDPSRGLRAAADLVALAPQDPNAARLQAQLKAATQK
jgi:tetratricopeptide (TPR) repeat protein